MKGTSSVPVLPAAAPQTPLRDVFVAWTREPATPGRGLAVGACGIGLMLGVWLTLRPSGDMPAAPWLPWSLLHWLNEHGRMRNVPAYFLLTLPALAATPRGLLRPVLLALGAFAAGLEFLQLMMASRHFDLWDIVLSWCGILLAAAVWRSLRRSLAPFSLLP